VKDLQKAFLTGIAKYSAASVQTPSKRKSC